MARTINHRTYAFVLSLVSIATLSACADVESGDSLETVAADQALYMTGTAWTNGIVPVCWTDGGTKDAKDGKTLANAATLRSDVRRYIEESWSHAANITFTNWGTCPSNPKHMVVLRWDSNYPRAATWGLGDPGANGVDTIAISPFSADLQYRAVHEMGHALGMHHEQQGPNNFDANGNPLYCNPSDSNTLVPGGTSLTAYDANSIMNYCSTTSTLSLLDIVGTRIAYGAHVKLSNRNNGLCVGVNGFDSHGPGAQIEAYGCAANSSDAKHDEEWILRPTTNGYFRLANTVSGLCLGVPGLDSHSVGTSLEVYGCDPVAGDPKLDEEWTYYGSDRDNVMLKNRASGLCLGVTGWDTNFASQSVLELYYCDSTPNRDQFWSIGATPVAANAVRIVEQVSGKCLGAWGIDNAGLGTPAEIWSCTFDPNDPHRDMEWITLPTTDGYFRLQTPVNNLCLGVSGFDTTNSGAAVEVYKCSPDANDALRDSEWRWVDVAGSYKKLQNRASGLCLYTNSYAQGSGIQMRDCNIGDPWVTK